MKRTSFLFMSVAIFVLFNNVQAFPVGEAPMEIDEATTGPAYESFSPSQQAILDSLGLTIDAERKPHLKRLLEGVTNKGDVTNILQVGSRAHLNCLSNAALFRPQHRAGALKKGYRIIADTAPFLNVLLEGVSDPKEMDAILDIGVSLPSNRLKFVKSMEAAPSLRSAALSAIKGTYEEHLTQDREHVLKTILAGVDKCEKPLETMKSLMSFPLDKLSLIEETGFEPRHRLAVFAVSKNLTQDNAPRLKTLLAGVIEGAHATQILAQGVWTPKEKLDLMIEANFDPLHRYHVIGWMSSLERDKVFLLKDLLDGVRDECAVDVIVNVGGGKSPERLRFVRDAGFDPHHRPGALWNEKDLTQENIPIFKILLEGVDHYSYAHAIMQKGMRLPLEKLSLVAATGFAAEHRDIALEVGRSLTPDTAPWMRDLLMGVKVGPIDISARGVAQRAASLEPEKLRALTDAEFEPDHRYWVVKEADNLGNEKMPILKTLLAGVTYYLDMMSIIIDTARLSLAQLRQGAASSN